MTSEFLRQALIANKAGEVWTRGGRLIAKCRGYTSLSDDLVHSFDGDYAALFAAAPDLLAESAAFVADFQAYIDSDDYDLPDPSALLAAIAKAEGRGEP